MGGGFFHSFKLDFLGRLSNIIAVQVVFVFAAVALILFYPQRETGVNFNELESRFKSIGERIAAIDTQNRLDNNGAKNELTDFFESFGEFLQVDVYRYQRDQDLVKVFEYNAGSEVAPAVAPDHLPVLLDRHLTDHACGIWSDGPIPVSLCTDYASFCYPFKITDSSAMVMMAAMEHDLLVSSKSGLQYALFLLFLVATLVALMTMYLISNKFKEPLQRLRLGLEKTACGDLYCMVDTPEDPELHSISTSFNAMSQTLWDDRQKLNQMNRLLQKAYIDQARVHLFLATLIDSSPCCIVAVSLEGEVVIFNNKAAEVFGCEAADVIGKNVAGLFATDLDRSSTESAEHWDESGREVVCRRHDGSMFPAYLVAKSLADENGQCAAHLLILLDISESKNFQDMMVRVDRYYSRGEMLGDIAHEINNYLAVISGSVELIPIFMRKGKEDKIGARLELMKTTVDKIVRFTDGLMDTNPDEAHFEDADLNQIIHNLLAFLKPQNRFDDAVIDTDLSSDIPLVQLDIGQIQQVLVNLITNAVDAVSEPKGEGRITLKTTLQGQGDDTSVRFEVADNGPGVPAENEDLLFKRSFTTKRKGHGLGLVTCRKLMDVHNGCVGYARDDATRFHFELPVKHREGVATDSASPAEPLTAGA